MAKTIKQYRYYGKDNSKNYPSGITAVDLEQGSIFEEIYPIYQLGIQAYPGAKIRLNRNVEEVIVGLTGIYELDVEGRTEIDRLQIDPDTINKIDNINNAYIIIDVIYDNNKEV